MCREGRGMSLPGDHSVGTRPVFGAVLRRRAVLHRPLPASQRSKFGILRDANCFRQLLAKMRISMRPKSHYIITHLITWLPTIGSHFPIFPSVSWSVFSIRCMCHPLIPRCAVVPAKTCLVLLSVTMEPQSSSPWDQTHPKAPSCFFFFFFASVLLLLMCLQVGNSWVENCTRYDCVETSVGAVILASGVVCPPFNDTECIQVKRFFFIFLLVVTGNYQDKHNYRFIFLKFQPNGTCISPKTFSKRHLL